MKSIVSRKALLLFFSMTYASTASYASDLVGTWDCQLSNMGEDVEPDVRKIDSILLVINTDGATYTRTGDSRWESISNPLLVLHTQTLEEGVLVIEGKKVKFAPLKGEVKALESGPLDPKELEQDLLESLLSEEDWVIKEQSSDTVVFERSGKGYIDTCTRSK